MKKEDEKLAIFQAEARVSSARRTLKAFRLDISYPGHDKADHLARMKARIEAAQLDLVDALKLVEELGG